MLFCLSANYTPKALEAMGKNPSNRREGTGPKQYILRGHVAL